MASVTFFIQEKIESECGLQPTEIVVGGSLGHGTALPWKFDADIVIYSEGVAILHACMQNKHQSSNVDLCEVKCVLHVAIVSCHNALKAQC